MKHIKFRDSNGSVDVLIDGDVQPFTRQAFTRQICTLRSLCLGETWCLALEYIPAELDGKRPVVTDVFAPPGSRKN